LLFFSNKFYPHNLQATDEKLYQLYSSRLRQETYFNKSFINSIAGHCRINPDWGRCRNADAGLTRRTNGKTTNAGITFFGIPAFLQYIQHHKNKANFLKSPKFQFLKHLSPLTVLISRNICMLYMRVEPEPEPQRGMFPAPAKWCCSGYSLDSSS
jgi:hypothetical protein